MTLARVLYRARRAESQERLEIGPTDFSVGTRDNSVQQPELI